jgi:hypothetical protein
VTGAGHQANPVPLQRGQRTNQPGHDGQERQAETGDRAEHQCEERSAQQRKGGRGDQAPGEQRSGESGRRTSEPPCGLVSEPRRAAVAPCRMGLHCIHGPGPRLVARRQYASPSYGRPAARSMELAPLFSGGLSTTRPAERDPCLGAYPCPSAPGDADGVGHVAGLIYPTRRSASKPTRTRLAAAWGWPRPGERVLGDYIAFPPVTLLSWY